MQKSPREYASDLVAAITKGEWKRVKQICKVCPMSIVSFGYGGACSPLFYCVSQNLLLVFATYFCHVVLENGIDIDATTTLSQQRRTYLAYFNFWEKGAKILYEYGGEPPNGIIEYPTKHDELIAEMVARHRAEITAKWERCRNASATIMILLRKHKLVPKSWMKLIGHDMTRCIAQEVWATKRHEKWEK